MSRSELWRSFIDASTAKLSADLAQVSRCAEILDDAQAWSRPNERCNSVANLIIHLTGNVGQWIVGGIGGKSIERDRPREFAARDIQPVEPLVRALNETTKEAIAIIEGLDETGLDRQHSIQGYEVSGMLAVFHVVEHFSFHTGQIVHITKSILDIDLSLFDSRGRRLNRGAGGQPW